LRGMRLRNQTFGHLDCQIPTTNPGYDIGPLTQTFAECRAPIVEVGLPLSPIVSSPGFLVSGVLPSLAERVLWTSGVPSLSLDSGSRTRVCMRFANVCAPRGLGAHHARHPVGRRRSGFTVQRWAATVERRRLRSEPSKLPRRIQALIALHTPRYLHTVSGRILHHLAYGAVGFSGSQGQS